MSYATKRERKQLAANIFLLLHSIEFIKTNINTRTVYLWLEYGNFTVKCIDSFKSFVSWDDFILTQFYE